jgi:hypothetical protein
MFPFAYHLSDSIVSKVTYGWLGVLLSGRALVWNVPGPALIPNTIKGKQKQSYLGQQTS